MNKRDLIAEQYPESKMLFIPNMDDAILGVDENRWSKEKGDEGDTSKERVVYSTSKIIEILVERDGLSYEDAREHFDYNVSGGYVGIHTPVFVDDELFDD